MPSAEKNAFTLVEIVCVCALVGILLAVVAPAVGYQVLQARIAAETSALQGLSAAAQASFQSTDLEGTNLAALPGSVPSGTDTTNFSVSTDPGYRPASTNTFDWFVKLARQLGYVLPSPAQGAPAAGVPAGASGVLYNANGNARFLLVGPSSEAAQQRFLIGSLVAAPGELAVPPLPNPSNPQDPANLALFNDIWNTNWTSPGAALPPTWTAALTAQQTQAWQGAGGSGGRLWQFCVARIVCPKFTLTLNDTHPTDNCYVYYNFNGGVAGSSVAIAADAGVQTVSGLLAGRLIQAYRGTAPPPSAQLFAQFYLLDNNEITLQD